jgi:hypothetical protein
MNPAYYDVATLINDDLAGYTLSDNLFGGAWGANIDAQALCLEGVGTPSDLKDLYEQPSVQILVRGDKNEADHLVYRRAKEISDFLLSQTECVTINGTDYKGFEEGANIAPLGKDDKERFIYSMNFYSWRNRY